MRIARTAASLGLGLLLAAPSFAEVVEYKIDPVHSNVDFRIRHLFSKVSGTFGKFSGTFRFDPADPAKSAVTAEIDAASIDTNNEKRDGHLRSADFFDVEKHPAIRFESTGVAPQGKDRMTMKGNLTMHGVTRPVELAVSYLGAGGGKAGFEAQGTLDRKEFGIEWNRALDTGGAILGDEVEITINVEANRVEPEKPAEGAAAPAPKATK